VAHRQHSSLAAAFDVDTASTAIRICMDISSKKIQQATGRLRNLRCSVRRSIDSARAAAEMFPPFS
jgi:hypothetical protein